MKSIKKHSIILMFITVLILFFVLKDNFLDIMNEILKMNIWLLLLAVIVIFLYWSFKALSTYLIARKYSKTIKLSTLIKQTIITQFFNGITPFSTGGQPMQVYMLTKNKISLANSTNIILQDFIVYQIALVLFGLFAIIMNANFNFFSNSTYLKKFVILGFMVNSLICIGVFILCFSKKVSRYLLKVGVNFGCKFKIIKNKDKVLEKGKEKIKEFQDSAKIYIKSKKLFVTGILVNILALALIYSIPLVLIKGMNISANIGLLTVIVSSAYVLLIGSFVPIPGGSGGIEFAFLQFFGNFLFNAELSALLLVWRFITYYLGIIIGGLLFNFYKVGDQ